MHTHKQMLSGYSSSTLLILYILPAVFLMLELTKLSMILQNGDKGKDGRFAVTQVLMREAPFLVSPLCCAGIVYLQANDSGDSLKLNVWACIAPSFQQSSLSCSPEAGIMNKWNYFCQPLLLWFFVLYFSDWGVLCTQWYLQWHSIKSLPLSDTTLFYFYVWEFLATGISLFRNLIKVTCFPFCTLSVNHENQTSFYLVVLYSNTEVSASSFSAVTC